MCVFSANIYPVCFRLLLYGKYCSHVESAISLLDFICKEKEGVRLKLEVQNYVSLSVIFAILHSHFIIYYALFSYPKYFLLRFCISFCVFIYQLLYVAGMFKESQQWEIHFERLACGSHAACAEIPTTASGTVTCTHTPTQLSLYIVLFELTLEKSKSHFWELYCIQYYVGMGLFDCPTKMDHMGASSG